MQTKIQIKDLFEAIYETGDFTTPKKKWVNWHVEKIMALLAKDRQQILKKVDDRAWVHIDEVDSKDHSAEFGRGWNANADDIVKFILAILEGKK